MVAGLKGNNTAHGQAHTNFRHIGVIILNLEGIAVVLSTIRHVFQGLIRSMASLPRQNSVAPRGSHTIATVPKDMGYLPKSFRPLLLLAEAPIIQQ
jgi:hypothetical protein